MANAIAGNTIYVDTTGSITTKVNTRITYIVLTATSANAVLVARDNAGTPVNKLDLRVAASGSTQVFDFSATPLLFPNGLNVGTLTNAVASFITSQVGA